MFFTRYLTNFCYGQSILWFANDFYIHFELKIYIKVLLNKQIRRHPSTLLLCHVRLGASRDAADGKITDTAAKAAEEEIENWLDNAQKGVKEDAVLMAVPEATQAEYTDDYTENADGRRKTFWSTHSIVPTS